MQYIALLRGVNVGGKNKVSMAELKLCFEDLGFENVSTYINSGNILFSSPKSSRALAKEIEATLIKKFKFDSEIIKTLVISRTQLKQVIDSAPSGFGKSPTKYHSDAVFLIGVTVADAMMDVELHPDVDAAWPGEGMVYYRRLSAKRTKSRLSKIIGKPVYKSMTIRSWNTVLKLYDRLSQT